MILESNEEYLVLKSPFCAGSLVHVESLYPMIEIGRSNHFRRFDFDFLYLETYQLSRRGESEALTGGLSIPLTIIMSQEATPGL